MANQKKPGQKKPEASNAPDLKAGDTSSGASLESRLAAARQASARPEPRAQMERGAFGIATRLVAELVSGLVVGGGLGWLLDHWLGTAPWLLVVFFCLGAAAGIMNVFRAAKQMNAAGEQDLGGKGQD